MKQDEQGKLTVSEKNESLMEELQKRGLCVWRIGQLGRHDFLVVSSFEPDPNAPPNGEPFGEEDIATKDHKNLFMSNP